MPADFTGLAAAIAALTAQVTDTVGVEASASAVLAGVSTIVQKAVSDALAADNAVDDAAAATANAAVADALAKLKTSRDALATAVAANPGPTPTPTPAPSQP